jgi:hypothetical protein
MNSYFNQLYGYDPSDVNTDGSEAEGLDSTALTTEYGHRFTSNSQQPSHDSEETGDASQMTFDGSPNAGRMWWPSKGEDEAIVILRERDKLGWAEIGDRLYRDAEGCEQRYLLLKSNPKNHVNRTPWNDSKDNLLLHAVDERTSKRLDWNQVCERFPDIPKHTLQNRYYMLRGPNWQPSGANPPEYYGLETDINISRSPSPLAAQSHSNEPQARQTRRQKRAMESVSNASRRGEGNSKHRAE